MTTSSAAAIRESLREEAQEAEFRRGRTVGWNGALDKVIEMEKSRSSPNQNLLRDLEALKQ